MAKLYDFQMQIVIISSCNYNIFQDLAKQYDFHMQIFKKVISYKSSFNCQYIILEIWYICKYINKRWLTRVNKSDGLRSVTTLAIWNTINFIKMEDFKNVEVMQ